MAQYFSVHPENPQPRLIRHAVDIIREGGVIAYPTDSCYALGCHIGDKAAMERVRRIRDVERHTIGVRIPDHPVALALLEALGEPLLSSTLILPAHGQALNDAHDIRRHLEHQLDLVIDSGACDGQMTTVVDLSGDTPRLIREGRGDTRPFGFVKEALH